MNERKQRTYYQKKQRKEDKVKYGWKEEGNVSADVLRQAVKRSGESPKDSPSTRNHETILTKEDLACS